MGFAEVKRNLQDRGFDVKIFATSDQAADYLDEQIDGCSVGMGGSVTLDQIAIYERLLTHNTVYWHQHLSAEVSAAEIKEKAACADVYISSVNGIAESGEIINIDGNCNRVAAIFYGHKKVYLVAGSNKLAKDYESALYRARNVAAPKNAKRLGRKTPCAEKADRCYDCSSPERICRGLSVLWQAPSSGEYEVILIDENLGY
jgi:hypothetical protein